MPPYNFVAGGIITPTYMDIHLYVEKPISGLYLLSCQIDSRVIICGELHILCLCF
jgi:hypothetical protein